MTRAEFLALCQRLVMERGTPLTPALRDALAGIADEYILWRADAWRLGAKCGAQQAARP